MPVNAHSAGRLHDSDITLYDWDHRNRVASVDHYADGEDYFTYSTADWGAQYAYDCFDRRIARSAWSAADPDGATEYFIYDKTDVVLDFLDADGPGETESPELWRRYLWNPQAVDQLFAQEDFGIGGGQGAADDVLWAVIDNLGSVRSLVDYTGAITSTFSYDSFGNVTVLAGSITDSRYLYTAQEWDPLTSLYHYDARPYDPRIGRFRAPDPSGLRPDVNPYRYCGNAPLTHTDPSGQIIIDQGAGPPNLSSLHKKTEHIYEIVGLGVKEKENIEGGTRGFTKKYLYINGNEDVDTRNIVIKCECESKWVVNIVYPFRVEIQIKPRSSKAWNTVVAENDKYEGTLAHEYDHYKTWAVGFKSVTEEPMKKADGQMFSSEDKCKGFIGCVKKKWDEIYSKAAQHSLYFHNIFDKTGLWGNQYDKYPFKETLDLSECYRDYKNDKK